MFRLKATLVAKTRMRPWRTGWSRERGVDFSLAAALRPAPAPPAARVHTAEAERACFIDEDWSAPAEIAAARTVARAAPERAPAETSGAGGLQSWWSLSGKPSRT